MDKPTRDLTQSSIKSSAPLLKRWVSFCGRRPGLTVIATLGVALLSAICASQLRINTDQLEMLNAESREVRDIRYVNEMIGGAGRLTLALRGAERDHLKRATALVAQAIKEREPERISEVSYRLPVDFLLERAPLLMATEDLRELRRRVSEKLADVKRRADPFFLELEETEPVALKVDDLLERYGKVGEKSVADELFISGPSATNPKETPGYMALIKIKPSWDSNQLASTGELVEDLRAWLTEYQISTKATGLSKPITFLEDYSPTPQADQAHLEFGFTGTYQTNYDDSYQIKSSLAPVSVFAFLGVLCSLLIFFGRRLFSIFLIVSGLLLGLVITFGWTAITVGELNMITSILGGILMGLGIDFGIHLLYRFRDELSRHAEVEEALVATLRGAGFASFISGLGTIAAFVSLLFSDFKGFSQFGFLAGSGVFLIGLTMYLWVPALVMWAERRKPGSARALLGAPPVGAPIDEREALSTPTAQRIPRPRLLIGLSGGIALALCALAPPHFEFNTRALMIEGLPSVRLQDEVSARFSHASDPVAVYTPTREAAREVLEYFQGEGAQLRTIDQAIGIHSFLPPLAQQRQNVEVMRGWKDELKSVRASELPSELSARWPQLLTSLEAKPFELGDLPLAYREPFEGTDASGKRGFITYVYAGVDLWDGREMIAFAREVGEIPVQSGTYHAAGMPLIFSLLTQIILYDGKLTVGLTFLALILILIVDFRRLSDVLIALAPLLLGVGSMLGVMRVLGAHLNLMNIVIFPIVIGYGVSHGIYLLHRVRDGVSPREALSSVGRAIACSTLTTLAGWAALLAAPHRGLQSMGTLACLGMLTSLLISFTLMPAILELSRQRRARAL